MWPGFCTNINGPKYILQQTINSQNKVLEHQVCELMYFNRPGIDFSATERFFCLFQAGENFPHPLSEAQMKKLSGTFLRKPRLPIKKFPHSPESVEPIPKSFDLRNKYPNCPSLFWVFEQSNCGGCYVSSVLFNLIF